MRGTSARARPFGAAPRASSAARRCLEFFFFFFKERATAGPAAAGGGCARATGEARGELGVGRGSADEGVR